MVGQNQCKGRGQSKGRGQDGGGPGDWIRGLVGGGASMEAGSGRSQAPTQPHTGPSHSLTVPCGPCPVSPRPRAVSPCSRGGGAGARELREARSDVRTPHCVSFHPPHSPLLAPSGVPCMQPPHPCPCHSRTPVPCIHSCPLHPAPLCTIVPHTLFPVPPYNPVPCTHHCCTPTPRQGPHAPALLSPGLPGH